MKSISEHLCLLIQNNPNELFSPFSVFIRKQLLGPLHRLHSPQPSWELSE